MAEQNESSVIVRVRPNELHDRVIEVDTADGRTWFYHMNNNGILTLGYPYITPYGRYVVTLFVPMNPGAIPIVISVKEN